MFSFIGGCVGRSKSDVFFEGEKVFGDGFNFGNRVVSRGF